MIAVAFGMVALIAASFLAFKEMNHIIFLITAGIAMMVGLYAPRAVSDAVGIGMLQGIGLLIVLYAFVCLVFAYIRLVQGSEE